MADCDSCGDREGKHRSREGFLICHKCAHEIELAHSHCGLVLTAVDHAELDGIELKDHLAAYLDEVRD